MSRDYRLIQNGKFVGESFNVNAAGACYLGEIMAAFKLPHQAISHSSSELGAQAPHKIVGEDAKVIRDAVNRVGFIGELRSMIEVIPNRETYSLDTVSLDAEWIFQFLSMANNPEGFASDYCEEYQ